MEPLKDVTDATFNQEVLKADKPVLVDFWAEWCGPCKSMEPALQSAAVQFEGSVSIVRLDVDNNQETTMKYGVRGIPTLMLFKNGEPVKVSVGALPRSRIVDLIEENL